MIDIIVCLDISFCGRLAYIPYVLATSTPPGISHLFRQPHPAPSPGDHNGSDPGGSVSVFSPSKCLILAYLGGISGLSPPSGVVPEGSHLLAEKCVAMRPILAQTPIPAEPNIATSPFASNDFAPPLSLQCAGGISAAHQGDSFVSNYSPNFNPHTSPRHPPSSPQRSTFLTNVRSCTPDYSPSASPPDRRAPSEITIDLCFTLDKRKETPFLQNSPSKSLIAILYPYRLTDPILTVSSGFPLQPESPNNAPSILSAEIPSLDLPSVEPSGMLSTQNFELIHF